MSSEESRREAKAETGVWGAASLKEAISAAEYVRGFDGGFGADAPFFAEFNASGSAALLGFRRLNDGNRGSEANKEDAADFADVAAQTTAEARARGVGIAGAGLMGVSIAAAFLGAGFPVLAFDSFATALETAPKRIEAELAEYVLLGGIGQRLPMGIPHPVDLNGVSQGGICLVPVLFICPVCIIRQAEDHRVEPGIVFPAFKDIERFLVNLPTDTVSVRTCSRKKEPKRLLSGITRALRHNIVQSTCGLRMKLIENTSRYIKTVLCCDFT